MKRFINPKMTLLASIIILTIILFSFVSYAWIVRSQFTKPVIINTGTIKTKGILFERINNDYIEVTDNWLHIEEVTPGQSYYFKLQIINEGTVEGVLKLTMSGLIGDEDVLKSFSLNYIDPTIEPPVTNEVDGVLFDLIDTSKNITFFNGYPMQPSEVFDFYFVIRIEGDNSQIKGKSITVTNYKVQLNQVGAPV